MASLESGSSPPRQSVQEPNWHLITSFRDTGIAFIHVWNHYRIVQCFTSALIFLRFRKEAQKCFCGAPSCRGFLGGENRVSVRAAGGKMKKDRTRKNALTTVSSLHFWQLLKIASLWYFWFVCWVYDRCFVDIEVIVWCNSDSWKKLFTFHLLCLVFFRLMRNWRRYWRMEKGSTMGNKWCLCAGLWFAWKTWNRNSPVSSSYT